jgi:hypothetical protein
VAQVVRLKNRVERLVDRYADVARQFPMAEPISKPVPVIVAAPEPIKQVEAKDAAPVKSEELGMPENL